jgi:MoxR-like ATPase
MSDSLSNQAIVQFQENFQQAREAISQVIVGYSDLKDDLLIAFLAGGHALLEGLPGLGKTLLVQTLTQVLGLSHNRIQFTPDLMPADILGTNVLLQDERGKAVVTFEKGPVFANLVLADEINRATPRTQSALLQAMQEHQVTIGGTTYSLPEPFMVIATQNPIEMEGTYPLPEAQLDRFFFKLVVPYPDLAALIEIASRTTRGKPPVPEKRIPSGVVAEMKSLISEVYMVDYLMEYTARLILATQPTSQYAIAPVKKYVQYGASPRGMQALVLGAKVRALLAGRGHVGKEDIVAVLVPALRHRILVNFEGEAEGISSGVVLQKLQEEIV